MAEKLEIGNIATPTFRGWSAVINGQISELKVVFASGKVSTLPSVEDRLVYSLPCVFLPTSHGFIRQKVCDKSEA
jgi:hypothetical protein